MNKQEEIIEVCGKKVVVRYARTQEEACASCAFCSRKECHDLDCNMRDIIGESVSKYAYFVEAEQPEEKEHPIPSDVQEAADEAAKKYGRYTFINECMNNGSCDANDLSDAFKAGIAYERERLMKEAPVADVIEMRGSTGLFTDYPFMLSLGFRKIPNIEFHGGKVRAIIEEIK